MTRKRLRPAHSPEDLARIYATPHNHTRWDDHVMRVDHTVNFAVEVIGTAGLAADLSCGSGAILAGLPVARRIFGDLAPGYEYTGALEQTLEQIPDVDLYVCCETLEHVDDPGVVLKQVRAKASMLLLSTPIEAWDDTNVEHYWAWDRGGVEELLADADWGVMDFMELDFRGCGTQFYCFGIWACR